MKKSNKGYTLAELLVTIAIFSIVMVGVCSIMTNSMKAYNVSTNDVSIQENSQIVTNQLEELLCEADSLGGDLSTGYTFSSKGENYLLSYNPGNHELSLSKGSSSNKIAENVTSFEIEGWNSGHDNSFIIKMTMDNTQSGKVAAGTSYTVEREVYSRNDPEDSDFYDIKYLKESISGAGPSPTGNAIAKKVKRYEDLNLTSECQIHYPGHLYKYTSDPEDPSDRTETDLYFDVVVSDDGFSNTTTGYAGSKSVILRPKNGVNTTFSNALGGNKLCYVGYKSWDDGAGVGVGEVVVTLDVDNVQFLDSNTVYQHHQAASTNNGIHIPIEVEGININEALKAGVSVSYSYDIKIGSVSILQNTPGTVTMSANTDLKISQGDHQENLKSAYGDRIVLGVKPEPYNGGVFVCTSNDNITTTASALAPINNADLFVTVTISGTPYTSKLKFDSLGTGF